MYVPTALSALALCDFLFFAFFFFFPKSLSLMHSPDSSKHRIKISMLRAYLTWAYTYIVEEKRREEESMLSFLIRNGKVI